MSFKFVKNISFIVCSFTFLLLNPTQVMAEDDAVKKITAATITTQEIKKHKIKRKGRRPLVYDRTVNGSMDATYSKIFTALENNSYYVIFESNLGKSLSHFAKRWGEDYNKNKLDSIRSLVFCNTWYTNKISNEDPRLLALCPMRITLYSKENKTHILFVRPSRVAGNSPAYGVAKELEDDVIRTIEVAISK